jgi:mannose/cellobiose epimerase-like protein (N-acyl-D-glucosamine 2-epimerase family)
MKPPQGRSRRRDTDLYDYAFALFALSWAYRLDRDPQVLTFGHKTMDAIDRLLAHSGGEWWLHEVPPSAWRQQNPHMHMLEAALSVYKATGDARFGDLARKIGALFQRRFYNSRLQTLAEFSSEDWSRASGEDGRRIEPGHQLEWA